MLYGIGLYLSLVHCLIIVLCIPLILEKVKRNRFYGFRLPKTLASDEVWYPANAMAGRALCLCSIVGLCIVQAADHGTIPLSENQLVITTIGSVAVGCIYSLIRLRTM